jgi:hypothetical protein
MTHALIGWCIYLMGSGALGVQKPNLSADFANVAVKYLMLVGNYEFADAESASTAQSRIASAFREMAATAMGDKTSPDNLMAASLKIFADIHVMNVKTYQLSKDPTELAKDERCITDWKHALQAGSANHPSSCR